nr:hypothetical protein CFP56_02337 [Quercus suber]
MGRFKDLVDTLAGMEGFRAKYHIPQGVALRYYAPDQIVIDRKEGEVVIPMITFIEGGMTLPMGSVTRDYLYNHRLCPHQCAPNVFRILGNVDALNEQMGLGLTWHNVVHMYECHSLTNLGYYLKSRSSIVRLISCLPKSNKGMKDDYLITSGEWHDGLHYPIREGKPVDKKHIVPRLSLVNVKDLNRVLRSKVFLSDPRRRRIDVSKPGFLAREVVVPDELPPPLVRPEGELDRSSAVHFPQLIIAKVNSDSKEKESMALNLRKGLKDLMAARHKGSSPKVAPKPQLPFTLPPHPPPLTTTIGLLPIANFKKKRKEQEVEESDMDQAEDQRKQLHLREIDLAIQKQLVLDRKADLEKAKTVTRVAKEAAEAARQAFYNLGVEETEIRLVEELVEVCRDYCKETWEKAFDLVGVPTSSEWRQAGSVYYPPDIREVPVAPTPSLAVALESSEQLLTAQAIPPLIEASK